MERKKKGQIGRKKKKKDIILRPLALQLSSTEERGRAKKKIQKSEKAIQKAGYITFFFSSFFFLISWWLTDTKDLERIKKPLSTYHIIINKDHLVQ